MPFSLLSRRVGTSLAFRFIAVSTLAFLALVPMRVLEVRHFREEALEAGYDKVSRIASAGTERLKDILDTSRTILTVATLLPTFAKPGTPDCHPVLTGIAAETPFISSLSAVNASGIITCSSASTAENLEVGDRAFLREAVAKRVYQVSGLVQSRRTRLPTLLAAMPVLAPGGTAALIMAINASWFDEVAQEVGRSAPGSLAMIIDEDGNIIGRTEPAHGSPLAPEATVSELLRLDREGARPVTLTDGATTVFAVREIPLSKSLLIVGVPQSALSGSALAIELNLLEDLAVAISVIILVFWLGHESFVRPVMTLAAAAHRLGRGRFDIDIDSSRWAREFQTLAAAVTAASESLADRAAHESELKAHLRAQSLEDPLTGLKNRRGLDQFVELEWRICRRKQTMFTVIAFDIDFFKAYNDCYGHETGDQALTAVARIMQDQAAQAGGIAARTGGEEFTLAIPDRTAAETKATADAVSLRVTALRIRHARSPLGILTISAGIASAVPVEPLTFSDIFRAADQALYSAKDAGRNMISIRDVAMPSILAPGFLAPGFPAPATPDDGGWRTESSRDTGNRTPQAFPSAMSR